MKQRLESQKIKRILESENINSLDYTEIENLFLEEISIHDYIPDGICQFDPRNGDRIVYNTARSHRPHDNLPDPEITKPAKLEKSCVICQGKTTGVLDIAELKDGFTFINKNLYPILYPSSGTETYEDDPIHNPPGSEGLTTHGLHFLQWTSSEHDLDWHNMDLEDRVVVMERLALLEQKLITGSSDKMPLALSKDRPNNKHGYVSIIKNYGRLVGGSLEHGHQQISFSNVIPNKILMNWQFYIDRGVKFNKYLLNSNPEKLVIRDYGEAVLLVPYFMRRPYDMFLVLKDSSKSYLHELEKGELTAISEGWHDATKAILAVMPLIGRETAYNVTTIIGPGAGIYFEFLPYTQEIGGMEHLGLYLCQGNPYQSADVLSNLVNHQE